MSDPTTSSPMYLRNNLLGNMGMGYGVGSQPSSGMIPGLMGGMVPAQSNPNSFGPHLPANFANLAGRSVSDWGGLDNMPSYLQQLFHSSNMPQLGSGVPMPGSAPMPSVRRPIDIDWTNGQPSFNGQPVHPSPMSPEVFRGIFGQLQGMPQQPTGNYTASSGLPRPGMVQGPNGWTNPFLRS